MVKIDIISGFLGAGKTTLIKKLFEGAYTGEKIALIENEFGEIGIDGTFLRDSGVNITEINSGCICCSLVGNFSEAIVKLIDEYAPTRIVIEPSGVGKLSDIIRAVEGVQADVTLNIVATVVDGGKCRMYLRNFGEFYLDQVKQARVIVVSKADKISSTKMDTAISILREQNPQATMITTPIHMLDSGELLGFLESGESIEMSQDMLANEHRHHHADDVFSSLGIETARAYSEEQLASILDELGTSDEIGIVLRAKGILRAEGLDSWYHFDYVSGDYEIRLGSPDCTGRVCIIGSNIDKSAIRKLFEVEI